MKQPTPVDFNNRRFLQFILRQSIFTTSDFNLRQIKLFFSIHIPIRETTYANRDFYCTPHQHKNKITSQYTHTKNNLRHIKTCARDIYCATHFTNYQRHVYPYVKQPAPLLKIKFEFPAKFSYKLMPL